MSTLRIWLVLPAHAGMIRRAASCLLGEDGAPRSRGDDPDDPMDAAWFALCSPLTRG